MTQNNYCDIVDNCKIVKAGNDMLKRTTNQYNKVVKQNKNLQGQLRELQKKYDELERDLLVVEELNTTLQLKIRELETDGLTLVKQIDELEAFIKKPKLIITKEKKEEGMLFSAKLKAPYGLFELAGSYMEPYEAYLGNGINFIEHRNLIKKEILNSFARVIIRQLECNIVGEV